MLHRRTSLAVILAGTLATASCTSGAAGSKASDPSTPTNVPSSSGAHSASPLPGAKSSPPGAPTPGPGPKGKADTPATAKRVHADELQQVPVLMYHQLLANPGADRYNETPAAFRAELARLQKDNFVPVTAADYVAGHIDIPAGKHPVVLTFDDSTNSQLAMGSDGKPLPNTAVGIMEAFTAAHPDFPAHATFFVNNGGFSQPALKWLHDNGFEVADHTVSHANLSTIADAQVQKEIGGNFDMITAATGAAPTTFALPYGMYPKNRALMTHGAYSGKQYSFKGVFLVGAEPAHSPFAKTFIPGLIPRIRSQSLKTGADVPYESSAELTVLEAHPERLFTSDGDPAVVSYPKSSAQFLGTVPAGMSKNVY